MTLWGRGCQKSDFYAFENKKSCLSERLKLVLIIFVVKSPITVIFLNKMWQCEGGVKKVPKSVTYYLNGFKVL